MTLLHNIFLYPANLLLKKEKEILNKREMRKRVLVAALLVSKLVLYHIKKGKRLLLAFPLEMNRGEPRGKALNT